MIRCLSCAVLLVAGGLVVAGAQDRTKQDRAKLVGLDTAAVEARIGPPAEKDELADSDEAYWIYKTRAGTLSVHFQNALVVDIDPTDFPVEAILK
jgi:hypothetical protein